MIGAAVLLVLGGLAILSGSFASWDTCPKMPCEGSFGFFSLLSRSGMDVGLGIVTAEVGLLLAFLGVAAARRQGVSPFRTEAIGLAGAALLSVGAYLVRTFVFREFPTYGPDEGVFLVVGGAVLAVVAAMRLKPADRSTRSWAEARRPALGLMILGFGVWGLAVGGHLGVEIEPLTYAFVLVALGIGLWPDLLARDRASPTTVGVLIVLYGGCSLGAILIGAGGLGLLEAMPVAVLLAVVVAAAFGTRQSEPVEGTTDAILTAIASRSGLLVASLLLTGAAVLLILARLLLLGSALYRLSSVDRSPADFAWLWWLLAAGLAIAGATVIAARRNDNSG